MLLIEYLVQIFLISFNNVKFVYFWDAIQNVQVISKPDLNFARCTGRLINGKTEFQRQTILDFVLQKDDTMGYLMSFAIIS